ncbi:hypothetical protein LDL08_17715 [Nonomuraea glycinis]|uniref:Uncharacterized protein n=1 Tax=Nonomuraea glycinis TaxID=2047744 RepID=A0A918A6I8_9ACTN|nr:hypothetical protein [Nonomuraea glycinis]MCA2178033.1 hypothetical protein [Nonomuraea glycinis]GGP06223.1 hypothetical protein GCM10012278_28770 [Nonomuraea glycinis]
MLDAGGPEAVTGHELAAAFGPEVRYAGQDVDAFEAGLAMALGAVTAAGVAETYRWIAANDPVKLYGPGPALDLHPAAPRTWIAAQRRPGSRGRARACAARPGPAAVPASSNPPSSS